MTNFTKDDLIKNYSIIAESTMPPVALFEFKDGTKIRIEISRSIYDYNNLYNEAKTRYYTMKRKEKIEKILSI